MERCWNNSALLALFRKLGDYGRISVSSQIWSRFCSAPDHTRNSFYGALMDGIRWILLIIGGWILESKFYKALSWLRDLYFRVTGGSLIFSLVHRLRLGQWLLLAFVFYLPIEYMIRDQLGYSMVASIWEEAFMMLAVAFVLWRRALRQSKAIARETPLDGYILLFIAVGLLLMSAVNPYPAVAWAGYRAVVQYMIWFFLVIRLIEDDKDFSVAYTGFVILGALLCLHGVYQFIVAVPIPASWVSQTEMGVRTRVFSLTGSPNIFGSLIVMLAPMAAALMYYLKSKWQKFLLFAVTGMMVLALLFTFSRGAWIGMVVAVIIFSLYVDRRLLGLMGVAVASVLVFIPSITSRLTYLFTSDYAEASAIGGRALRWEIGRMLVTENNPWLGFGLGRFGGAVAMNNKLLDETLEFRYFYMDNYYLKTMVEMGYIGIFFYLLLIIALLVFGIRAIHRSSNRIAVADASMIKKDPLMRAIGDPKLLTVGIFAGLCGVLAHCYFENIFEEPYMMAYFWGLAAMVIYRGYFSPSRV